MLMISFDVCIEFKNHNLLWHNFFFDFFFIGYQFGPHRWNNASLSLDGGVIWSLGGVVGRQVVGGQGAQGRRWWGWKGGDWRGADGDHPWVGLVSDKGEGVLFTFAGMIQENLDIWGNDPARRCPLPSSRHLLPNNNGVTNLPFGK